MVAVYVITRELTLSISVGVIDVIAKLFFYYIHERAWIRVEWGKGGRN